MIFLYPTGGGESWHHPRPGLWLWDRSDQQARPVAGFQECGTGGYDGEFPGWGPKLPAGQGGQSGDVLLQKPPGIHTSPTKIRCHLDSVGFRLVLCDFSSLTSHRIDSLWLKEVLKSLGPLPKTSQETSESSPKPYAQWVQIKLVFPGHVLEKGTSSWTAACMQRCSWGGGFIYGFSWAGILFLSCQWCGEKHGAGLTCEQWFLNLLIIQAWRYFRKQSGKKP